MDAFVLMVIRISFNTLARLAWPLNLDACALILGRVLTSHR